MTTDETTDRIQSALADVLAEPSGEPGAWPPRPLSPATAPRIPISLSSPDDGPTDIGVAALAAAIIGGSRSPVEVVEALLERSAHLQPSIEAWATLDPERARLVARQREVEARAGEIRGPLHGVPLGAKDIFHVAGLPTRANSTARADAQDEYDDAESVTRLKAAGAIILGKTATTEFAYMDPSPARNPWNPAHTPGGSSSGSAAAVAARLVPGALGTQTAGSVLRPAAFCGIVGFKPTTERISRMGVLPLAWSLDHVGTLTRSVADAALLYTVMAGAEQTAWHDRPPSLGFAGSFLADRTTVETRDALTLAAATLRQAGAAVVEVDLEPLGLLSLAVHQVIMAAEVSAYHLGAHADRLDQLGTGLQALIRAGESIPARGLLRARTLRRRLWERWNPVVQQFDAVIVPSTSAPGTAPQGLAFTGGAGLNAPWSLLGVPAITLPITVAANGLPLGMQLVSAYGEDARLLAVATWCERAVDFRARPDGVQRSTFNVEGRHCPNVER